MSETSSKNSQKEEDILLTRSVRVDTNDLDLLALKKLALELTQPVSKYNLVSIHFIFFLLTYNQLKDLMKFLLRMNPKKNLHQLYLNINPVQNLLLKKQKRMMLVLLLLLN